MGQKSIRDRFAEAAKPRLPKNIADEKIDDFVLSVLTKTTVKKLIGEINTEFGLEIDAKRFVRAADIITIGEVERAIREFPHLHKKQVLRLFDNALVNKTVRLDSSGITRPQLIDLVELLEDYTGLRITDDSEAPLAYLDRKCNTLQIEDIGDFFSERKDSKIKTILDSIEEAKTTVPEISETTEAFLRLSVKRYLANCCGIEEEELREDQPIRSLRPNTACGERPYYIVVYWAEGRFNKVVPNDFVESKTIGNLIDFLAAA